MNTPKKKKPTIGSTIAERANEDLVREACRRAIGGEPPDELEGTVRMLEKHFASLGVELLQCDVCNGWSPREGYETCPFCGCGDHEVPPGMFGFLYHRTDTGNAKRFADRHRGDVRFISTWGKWLVWHSTHWAEDHSNVRVGALAGETALSIYDEVKRQNGKDERDAHAEWARLSESKGRRDAMVQLAKSEPGIAITHRELDLDPYLLNVANGTLDLKTGELREHRREDLITRVVPITYDASAACPTWIGFLRRVMGGDEELVDFIRRAAGYSLTGDVSEHVLLFLHGSGANGKSTLVRILLDLLGPYATAAAPNLLVARSGEAHSTEQADLFAVRLAVCQEVDQKRAWAEATVKMLTGGDVVKARRMREDFWEFSPSHKFWIAANHRPSVLGDDLAMWRRIKLIPFAVTIPEHERDTRLLEKLRAELPGILAWSVKGCMEWQRIGLAPPKAVELATKEYRQEEDLVARFVEERCTTTAKDKMQSSVLYDGYVRWCRASGEEPDTQKSFSLRLKDKGFESKKTKHGIFWAGIALLADVDEFAGVTGEGRCMGSAVDFQITRDLKINETSGAPPCTQHPDRKDEPS